MSFHVQAKRSDALRPMILYHYGGLYLDLDVECYRPSDDSFQQFDLMLQGSGNEGFNNAMMASVPGRDAYSLYFSHRWYVPRNNNFPDHKDVQADAKTNKL